MEAKTTTVIQIMLFFCERFVRFKLIWHKKMKDLTLKVLFVLTAGKTPDV